MARYMVIEHFRSADPKPVYERLRAKGRLIPAGLSYVDSWVDARLERRYQLVETTDRALLDQGISESCDLVEFEVHEVITSREAAERVLTGA